MSHLVERPIDVGMLSGQVVSPGYGAVVTFVGTVRDHHAGRAVLRLEYSVYAPMAEAEISRIIGEAEGRWPVRVAVEHRIGMLEIGETAVAVVVGAGHRDGAFDGCRFVIEEVKRRVPIWKREHYVDGTAGWVDATVAGGISF